MSLRHEVPTVYWRAIVANNLVYLKLFKEERMSHLCDSTVAGPTARRDNVLASKCEHPPFRYPLLNWGSPKASHIEASHPHFPHFPRFRVRIFRIFRVFVLRSLLRPLFSWGGRDVRIFRIFAVSGLNR